MPSLQHLLSQYSTLTTIARYISALDLYHLAITSSHVYCLIHPSPITFNNLTRLTLCDGRGLLARQSFRGIYNGLQGSGILNWQKLDHKYPCFADEEQEVRVWSVRCDSANVRPCEKCSINICRECRMVPRWRNHDAYDPSRRPHHNTTYQCVNVVAYCAKCEEEVEKEKTIGIGEWCDCDRYERWVCLRCVEIESAEEEWYHSHCDELTYRLDPEHCGSGSGLVLPDHQGRRMLWCPCGKPPPEVKDANVRCIWCKRKHPTSIIGDWEGAKGIILPDEDPYDIPPLEWESLGLTTPDGDPYGIFPWDGSVPPFS